MTCMLNRECELFVKIKISFLGKWKSAMSRYKTTAGESKNELNKEKEKVEKEERKRR